jgi:hypothetical protein
MGCELSRYLQGTGKVVSIPVAGTSMFPVLKPGDRLSVLCVHESFRIGQVLVILGESAPIVHRVVDSFETGQGKTYVTKGDNSRSLDRPVSLSEILGKVETIERKGRTCSLDQPLLRSLAWSLARVGGFLGQGTSQPLSKTNFAAHGTRLLLVPVAKSLFLVIRSAQGCLVSWLLWRGR